MLSRYKADDTAREREHFARRLITLLRSKDMSQADLSRACGLSRDATSKYARGVVLPTPKNMVNIAKALGVQPADLMLPSAANPSGEAAMSMASSSRAPRAHIDLAPNGKAFIDISGEMTMEAAMSVIKAFHDALDEAD